MSGQDQLPAEAARLLAEIHVARGLALRLAEPRAATGSLSVAELWAYARREPGEPVSLSVERALRGDAAVARRYRTMLASAAVAHAPLAIAASTGPASVRRVGEITITIDDSDEEAIPLVIFSNLGERTPRLIEVLSAEESLRLALPDAVGGAIVLSADPAIGDMALLLRLLRDSRSEIFLL